MLPEQWEFRRFVVEPGIQPLGRLVTGRAFETHCVLVRLVFPMTVDTFGRRFSMPQFRLVTVQALGLSMRTSQFEVGEAMIEGLLVQHNDDRISPFVVSMAAGALVGLHFRSSAMKPLFIIHVIRDVLVTAQTKIPLSLLIEQFVTAGTLAFDVGMPLNNVSGHHKRLNILSGYVVKCEYGYCHHESE